MKQAVPSFSLENSLAFRKEENQKTMPIQKNIRAKSPKEEENDAGMQKEAREKKAKQIVLFACKDSLTKKQNSKNIERKHSYFA